MGRFFVLCGLSDVKTPLQFRVALNQSLRNLLKLNRCLEVVAHDVEMDSRASRTSLSVIIPLLQACGMISA